MELSLRRRVSRALDRPVSTPTVDVVLAAVALVGMVWERLAKAPELGGRLPVALVLAVVIAGGAAFRHRAPLAAYVLGSTALGVEALWVMTSGLSPYVNLICLYSLGQYGSRRRALWGPVVALAGILAYFARSETEPAVPTGVLFLWLLGWAVGYTSARRRERQEAARRIRAREAVADERVRIARELHDLVGHTVNVMLVQAGAARFVLDSDPGQTREILLDVERTGRETLDELDRVLGVLRPDTDADLRPGLAELPRLAERMAGAGLDVTLDVQPATRDLARSLDVSAYRIAQEALTNALRHGRAVRATVAVRCDGRVLEVEVRDDGRGPQPGYRPGRGLLGIAERAAVFAGSVTHGAGEPGGFRIRAVLPVPGPGARAVAS
ncbi:histidine kinase [Longispora sp. NPDC051575]|uniref:sensor histidine kinase n=1 Tax=Longispora sp. NPDC051575 TaxID=3154943 RepID=UPI003425AD54